VKLKKLPRSAVALHNHIHSADNFRRVEHNAPRRSHRREAAHRGSREFVACIAIIVVFFTARAQDSHVIGKVTYRSAGIVYASIGWEKGVQDSTILFVVAALDTIANLKVFAVSSKTCACTIVRQKREIVTGNDVVVTITKEEKPTSAPAVADSVPVETGKVIRGLASVVPSVRSKQPSMVNLRGRVSLQYFASAFDNTSYDFTQPGLVVNLRATSPAVPLTLEVYGNLRTFVRGGLDPFSSGASNASRIYRFSLEYDDPSNDIMVGRIIPSFAPSIGSIDGISYARKFGDVTGGVSLGFQPTYNLQGLSSDTRKAAVFAQYRMHGAVDFALTGAYARSYFRSLLDREAVSLMVNGYSTGGISVYGYTDIDLRTKQGGEFAFSPSLSMASLNFNYRVAGFLTVGVGADASRAVFPYSMVQFVADSLLDRSLRSGASVTVNLSPVDGVNLFNTYSPRSANGGFGSEYLNSSTFFLTNAFSTGATVRATYTLNENEFTSSRGYGVNFERNFFGVDLTLRYQQNAYTILQLNQANNGETIGADVMVPFTRQLSFMLSAESMRGFGPTSYTVFTELSWRF
jgi:hypothetical protein